MFHSFKDKCLWQLIELIFFYNLSQYNCFVKCFQFVLFFYPVFVSVFFVFCILLMKSTEGPAAQPLLLLLILFLINRYNSALAK